MYGMMPSAKTVRRRMLPPANRSKKPKIEPGLRAEELRPALQVDARRGDVAAQTIHRQQPQREQEPLAEIRDAKHVRERFKKLVMVPFDSRRYSLGSAPITCAVPPAFWIFSSADFEKWWASTVILRVNCAVPRIFRPSPSFLDRRPAPSGDRQ